MGKIWYMLSTRRLSPGWPKALSSALPPVSSQLPGAPGGSAIPPPLTALKAASSTSLWAAPVVPFIIGETAFYQVRPPLSVQRPNFEQSSEQPQFLATSSTSLLAAPVFPTIFQELAFSNRFFSL